MRGLTLVLAVVLLVAAPEGASGIYVIGADGRGRWPAVKLPNWRIDGVAWSRDARRIAFGASGIWAVKAVGGV